MSPGKQVLVSVSAMDGQLGQHRITLLEYGLAMRMEKVDLILQEFRPQHPFYLTFLIFCLLVPGLMCPWTNYDMFRSVVRAATELAFSALKLIVS